MRFVLVIVALALAALAGLFIYGQLLDVDTQLIEQEAARAPDA